MYTNDPRLSVLLVLLTVITGRESPINCVDLVYFMRTALFTVEGREGGSSEAGLGFGLDYTRPGPGERLTRRVLSRIRHHFISLCRIDFGN